MEQPLVNPPVPYTGAIHGGFTPGKMVRIQGYVSPVGQRFNINFQTGPNSQPRDDIAFHISVRLSEGYIARNSLQQGSWGEEQGSGTLPIGTGEKFEIIILAEPNQYKIAVNGKHYTEFSHRISLDRVNHLLIDGDVSLSLISWEGGSGISSSAPTAPLEGTPRYSAPPSNVPYGGGPPPQGQYGPSPGQYGPSSGPYGPYGPPPGAPYGGPNYPPMQMPQPASPRAPFAPPPSSAMPMPPYPLSPYPPNSTSTGFPNPPPYPQQPQPYPTSSPFPSYPNPYAPPAYPTSPNPANNGKFPSMITSAAAAMPFIGGKKMKKSKLKTAMKYGLPIAGAGVGAYALSKAFHGHHHHFGSSSSSSSSSSDSD